MEVVKDSAEIDYSIHYGLFHPETRAHTDSMILLMSRVIEEYLPADKNGSVLDIGCGYGFALLALRKMGFSNVHGVEISEHQALRARQNGLDVSVHSDTVEWLGAHVNQYSAILLLDVLEHVEPFRQIELLRAIYRSLRPDGRLIVQVPNANSLLASRWRYIDFTHYSSFTEHSLYFVLRNAGFDKIELKAEKGLGRVPKRLWRGDARQAFRKYLVRWCWLQVFRAEIPWEKIDGISFELNLIAVAHKNA